MRLPLTRDMNPISKLRLYSRLGLSEQKAEKIREDVYAVIDLVAATQGVHIPRKDMPRINFAPGESSAYNRQNNSIQIALESIGKGETYASEAGHFIRSYVTGTTGTAQSEDMGKLRVEEFFDRAAYRIAREKAKGTVLEPLFKDKGTDYSSKEGRKKLADLALQARKQVKEEQRTGNMFSQERARGEIIHARTHQSYALADQYSPDELLVVKGLYALPDEEIKKRFLHKKKSEKSGLEKAVEAVFYAASAIFAVYILASMKITGLAILGSGIGFGVGTSIGILFFLLLLAFLYLRMARRLL